MGDFKKFGSKRGRSGFGGGRPDRRGGEQREMFKATCAKCGRPCEVPFRPSGDRPVYCRDCFQAMGPQQDRNDRGSSRGQREPFQRRESPRPSFASTQGSGEDKRLDDLAIQLATVISKLDKLINFVTNTSPQTRPPKPLDAKGATLQDALAGVTRAPVAKTEAVKGKTLKKKSSRKRK